MSLWRLLADWCCPPSALSDIGRVHWRIRGGVLPDAVAAIDRIALGIGLPPELLPKHDLWVRWPTLEEHMLMVMRRHAKHVEARLTAELRARTGRDDLVVSFEQPPSR